HAMVTVADVMADNGVVHVIDAVLLPPTTTVVDIIVNSEDHNTLEAAVIAAELADDLAGEGPFTVFAPTDDAFAALPEGTVEALLEDPTGDLAQILLYHVVAGKAMSTDLSDGQMIETLQGANIKVTKMKGEIHINDAKVIIADILTDNGVVHVIDAVLSIPDPTSIGANLKLSQQISVSPNPATSYVNISVNNNNVELVDLSLIDASGVVLFNDAFYGDNYTLELSSFNKGLYFIIFKKNGEKSVKKIIKR
ncbi:fasciclin domain-containing protein, partial [Saccharicrinis sp. GN24d3]|uniref:fasciclin domain-containing protein n=1 Tax=Saccharicrinis sp. GN24d3 TaxID=3458416 RepID=UPI0040359FFB